MVVWINGPFGVGKSTAARSVADALPGWRLFDPEEVGFMLRATLADHAVDDFQDLPPWRTLVPACIDEIRRFSGHGIVAVQTVLRSDYWAEIRSGLSARGLRPRLVVLTADESVLLARIQHDTSLPQGVRQWREAHVREFMDAVDFHSGWLAREADALIDTTRLTPEETAAELAAVLDREAVEQP